MGRDSEIMDARYAALEAGEFDRCRGGPRSTRSARTAWSRSDLEGRAGLSVVYVPGATVEDLGLPSRPEGNTPG